MASVSLREVHDLTLKTIDGHGLRSGNLEDPINVSNNLGKVRILFLFLFLPLLLVHVKHLSLLDSDPRHGVFLAFRSHVFLNHLFHRWLFLEGSDLDKSSDNHIFDNVLQVPRF